MKYACLENRLTKLPGFGEKTQAKVLEGIENLGRYAGQYYFYHAMYLAEQLVKILRESGLIIRCSEGESLRRRKETVKDIDILASSNNPSGVMELFTSHPLVIKVTSKGDTKYGCRQNDLEGNKSNEEQVCHNSWTSYRKAPFITRAF